MQNATGKVKIPINEPAEGLKAFADRGVSRVQRWPGSPARCDRDRRHRRDGRALRANGVELLETPPSYYETLGERVGAIEEDVAILRELSILVTRTTAATCCRSSPSAAGPADALLRDHSAARVAIVREGQLQSAVRVDRARTGQRGNL